MSRPSDRFKWIQASLVVLIVLILAFLALSPVSRASTPEDRPIVPISETTSLID